MRLHRARRHPQKLSWQARAAHRLWQDLTGGQAHQGLLYRRKLLAVPDEIRLDLAALLIMNHLLQARYLSV